MSTITRIQGNGPVTVHPRLLAAYGVYAARLAAWAIVCAALYVGRQLMVPRFRLALTIGILALVLAPAGLILAAIGA